MRQRFLRTCFGAMVFLSFSIGSVFYGLRTWSDLWLDVFIVSILLMFFFATDVIRSKNHVR